MDYLKEIPQFNHLNEKQKKFIMHYFTDSRKNGTDAAIKAGYSEKGASRQAVNLMKDNRIKMIVEAVNAKDLHDFDGLRRRLTVELASIAFSNVADFMEWSESFLKIKGSEAISVENQKVIAEISENINMFGTTRKLKLHDKLSAIRELNKMYGFYAAEEYKVQTEGEVKQTTLVILPSNGREGKKSE